MIDEPSAGLHPADAEALFVALDHLKRQGNSLFIVEHDLEMMRRADWLVNIGPEAGEHGGQVLYSGPPDGLKDIEASRTGHYLFAPPPSHRRATRVPKGWLGKKAQKKSGSLDSLFFVAGLKPAELRKLGCEGRI